MLTNARIITSNESLKLLSDVRLGVNMGIIKKIDITTINEIAFLIQPSTLQKVFGTKLNEEERNIKRAELIRTKFII